MNPPGPRATLNDWLAWLETLSPATIELGLDRVLTVLERLALPRPARVVTVAGTNGKGSSVAMLEALYREAGARVGSYTSPHVLEYAERIRVDCHPTSEAAIIAAFERVETVRDGLPLTYFEYGTLAALCEFASRCVDTVILEVGLGGRLDAVNAIDPDGALITNVSLDHCDWLGNDVETIAAEKAGVMRPAIPVVFGAIDMPRAIDAAATWVGAELIRAGREFSHRASRDGRWDWSGRRHTLRGLSRPALGGDHQLDNAAAVLALLEALGPVALLEKQSVNRALSALQLPGRLQRVESRGRRWLLDGAHNPAGAAALAAELSPRPAIAVIGILEDKDARAIVEALGPRVDRWVACAPQSRRALPAGELAAVIRAATGRSCPVVSSVEQALSIAFGSTREGDLILVAGSFYTVGQALRWLEIPDGSRSR